MTRRIVTVILAMMVLLAWPLLLAGVPPTVVSIENREAVSATYDVFLPDGTWMRQELTPGRAEIYKAKALEIRLYPPPADGSKWQAYQLKGGERYLLYLLDGRWSVGERED